MKIREAWEQDAHNFNKIMLWAAVCLCFFGFLRAGEMTVPSFKGYDEGYHLNFDDVAVDNHSNPSLLRVRIKGSKTDPFREGVHIFLGRAHNKLCPVEAMLAYLAVRGSAPGFLFKFADGHLLTKEHFTKEVREALLAKGVKAELYAGHSFRIGAATTAAKHGICDSTIKMLGRWESSAYLLYIRTPRDQLAKITKIISS